ncbi:MAG: hypothetical protein ABDH37_00185 [Candidatus Hydrothermales bacterium]
MAIIFIFLIFSQISLTEYLNLRSIYIRSSNFVELEEISYKMFQQDKYNALYISDLLLALSVQKKKEKFYFFCDSLFKYFKNPAVIFPVVKTIEKFSYPEYVKFLIEKAREKFDTKNLYVREYLSSILKLKEFSKFWDEFLSIKDLSPFLDIFSDYLSNLNKNYIIKVYEDSKQKNLKELFPIFIREFLKRGEFEYVIEMYSLLGKKKQVDSLVYFLYENDPASLRKIIDKIFNDCEKISFFLKVENYNEALNYRGKCKDEKLNILTEIYSLILSDKKSKAESIAVKNIKILADESLELGKIFYNTGNYKAADSILKKFNNFDIFLMRAKINIFLDRIERADSILSQTILRFPEDEKIYKALFLYYLVRFEKREKLKLIVECNEKTEENKDFELEGEIDEKWKNYFLLKKEIRKGNFFEIKDTLFDSNFLSILYFEGYHFSLKEGNKETAKKFLKYIVDNLKDSALFIVAQRKIKDI